LHITFGVASALMLTALIISRAEIKLWERQRADSTCSR
jgi:hypothetical protein